MVKNNEKLNDRSMSSGWDFSPLPYNVIPRVDSGQNVSPVRVDNGNNSTPKASSFDWDKYSNSFDKDFDRDLWDEEEPLYYKLASLSPDERNSLLQNSDPMEQIKYLSLILKHAINSENYGIGLTDPLGVKASLQLMQNDKKTAPLVRLESEYLQESLDEYSDMLTEGFDLIEDSEYEDEQLLLRKKYPSFNPSFTIREVAPGVAKQGEYYSFHDGKTANWHELPIFDEETAQLLDVVYDSEVNLKGLIDENLGLDLSDISLPAQIQLLKFMAKAGDKRFDRLCATMRSVDPKLRLKVAEEFLAANFGEDFGDALLDIASSERLSNNEKERVLDAISSCRESAGRITDLYTDFDDGKFTKEYARASNERLTDAITVFQRIAKNGVAEADLDWAGKPRFDFDKAIEALEYEAKSLEIISGTLGDVQSGVKGAFAEVVLPKDESLQRLNRTLYNFYSPQYGYVLLYTRPEGSHSFDSTIEFGKARSKYREDSVNVGTEASISLIANPVDPFSLPNPYRPDRRAVKNPRFYDPATMDKVSAIRLDREGRAPGMVANDNSRDPVNPIGMVSVDLAAIGDRADTPSGKIARLLSVGGKLRGETSGVDSSLNHNTKWFDQDSYGTAEGFRELVRYIDKIALRLCAVAKPGDKAESFTRLKKQKLGKTAQRIA